MSRKKAKEQEKGEKVGKKRKSRKKAKEQERRKAFETSNVFSFIFYQNASFSSRARN